MLLANETDRAALRRQKPKGEGNGTGSGGSESEGASSDSDSDSESDTGEEDADVDVSMYGPRREGADRDRDRDRDRNTDRYRKQSSSSARRNMSDNRKITDLQIDGLRDGEAEDKIFIHHGTGDTYNKGQFKAMRRCMDVLDNLSQTKVSSRELAGEVCLVHGPPGCGKTYFLKSLLRRIMLDL